MEFLKQLIKKYLWKQVFYNKIYGSAAEKNKEFLTKLDRSPVFSAETLNVFTNAGEDGIILNIFEKISNGNKVFIDIGSNDCINSNCANLSFHHHWSGIFIDGNKTALGRGEYIYKKHFAGHSNRFRFIQAIVTPSNINEILSSLSVDSEVDLLSIDLDGNDYFIWEKIACIDPRVVITEVQVEKGYEEFIPEYSNEFEPYETGIPKGASALSMQKLAETKGYKLVAANKGCYNLFFVRKDCMARLQELNLEEALQSS